MGVRGEWGRGVARAGSVALLVPVALVLGVALTATLGGGDRLHALGQIVGGPDASEGRSSSGEPDLQAAVRVPPLRLASSTGTAVVRRTTGTGRRTAPTRRRTPTATRPRRPATTPAPSQPTSSPAPSSSGGGSSPPPSSPPPSNPVRDTGEQAVGVVQQLPAPVGPVAGDTVQTVVDLVAPPPGG
jgi:hypothetical protein